MAATDWIVGALTAYYVQNELVTDTYSAPAVTDAFIPPAPPTIDYARPDELTSDRIASLGHIRTRQLRQDSVKVTIPGLIRPSGTAGTPPDDHPIWMAMMGGSLGYTNTGSTSDVYQQSNARGNTIQLDEYSLVQGVFGSAHAVRTVNGALCMSWSITADGSTEPSYSATFEGMTYHRFFSTGIAGVEASGQAAIDVDSSTGDFITLDSSTPFPVPIGFYDEDDNTATDDNSGNGFTVSSVSTDEWTISANLNNGLTATDEARAVFSGITTAGSPLPIGGHTVTIGGANFDLISLSINGDNGGELKNDELTSVRPHDALRSSRRQISGSCTFHLRQDRYDFLVDAFDGDSVAIIATLGTTAGAKCKLQMDTCRLTQDPSWNHGDENQITATVNFKCLMSSRTANDELVVTFF